MLTTTTTCKVRRCVQLKLECFPGENRPKNNIASPNFARIIILTSEQSNRSISTASHFVWMCAQREERKLWWHESKWAHNSLHPLFHKKGIIAFYACLDQDWACISRSKGGCIESSCSTLSANNPTRCYKPLYKDANSPILPRCPRHQKEKAKKIYLQ